MKMIPITTGEILLEGYFKPMNISAAVLAYETGINIRIINQIITGHQKISPEISLQLGTFFKQGPRFWYNIETTCEFQKIKAEEKKIISKV